MKPCLKSILSGLFIAVLQASTCAHALEWDDGKGQVHGFLSQGMVASSHNNFYGDSSDGVSWDFREIGLNASYRFKPGIQFSGQVISRRAGEMDTGALWVDYAFADITLLSSEAKQVGIRMGRVKNPYGIYNESRDAAFARPGAVVPQPVYFDKARKFILSADGIQPYGRFEVPTGTLEWNLSLGKSPINERSSKATLVGYKAPGDLRQDRLTTGFRILHESADQRWLAGVSYFSLHQEYDPEPGDAFPRTGVLLEPWLISLRYSGEKWTVSSEYMLEKTEFNTGGTQFVAYAQGWYIQGQYRFMPDLELLLRYDYSTADRDDSGGREFETATGQPAHTRYAHDYVIGAKYDITSSFMLRAEWHHLKGTFWLSSLDNPNSADLKKDWDMFMLLGSWHF